MLPIQYATSRILAWSVWLWISVHLFYVKDLIGTFKQGRASLSVDALIVFLVVAAVLLTYQMLLNQRLVKDVASSINSFGCDAFFILSFVAFAMVGQQLKLHSPFSLQTNVVIAIALLVAFKWKGRFVEIRADRTVSRFMKSFSVHVGDKSLKAAILLLPLYLLKEFAAFVFLTAVLRRPLTWQTPIWHTAQVVFHGVWMNFLLDYAMVTLEYFLFHPINFTQSPWVQIIPKMGLRSIKGTTGGNRTTNPTNSTTVVGGEHFLMDYLHGMTDGKAPSLPRKVTQTGKGLLQTVRDSYHRSLSQLQRNPSDTGHTGDAEWLGIQHFVFTSHATPTKEHQSSGWTSMLLAPVYGYLECQAVFDLHRITRSSKLRREPLFRAHFEEWLSGILSFFLTVNVQLKEVLHFVKDPYETEDFLKDMSRLTSTLSTNGAAANAVAPLPIGVESMIQTQGQGVGSINAPFTFPRSPERRYQQSSFVSSTQDTSATKASSASTSSSSKSDQRHYRSFLVNKLVQHVLVSLRRRSTPVPWLLTLDGWLCQGELSVHMACFLCLGAVYQFMGFLWQLPLRGEVSDRKRGGSGGEVTSSLRRYFAHCFSPLFAQELVNALDSTSTLLYLALAEDRTAFGMKSTGALLPVVYVLLLFEETIEEIIDLLHQTHTTKLSMAKAMMATSAAGASTGANVEVNSMSATASSDYGAVSYRRFKLKSLQSLPRELIALRRGVKEALAKIWRAYFDILIVQELPVEVQARALEYRRAAMVSYGK
eukprot:gene13014-9311_t